MSDARCPWRVGRKVPRNLYRGDEPIAMLATPETAAAMVALLNFAEGCFDSLAAPEARVERFKAAHGFVLEHHAKTFAKLAKKAGWPEKERT